MPPPPTTTTISDARAGVLEPALVSGPRLRAWQRSAAGRAELEGRIALVALVLVSLALAVAAAAGPSALVPRSDVAFPGWLSGPLHGLAGSLGKNSTAASIALSIALLLAAAAYALAVRRAGALRPAHVVAALAALHAVFLLCPPLQLTDVFNYIGYARLGALHGLDPYVNVIASLHHDPVYPLATWHHLRSPYGPLFTLASYGLGPLSLPIAYWLLKAATIAASAGVAVLVWRIARRLGRDPRAATLLVVANPLYLVYLLGGAHNDVFLLCALLGGIELVLARREQLAAGAVVAAIAIKASAVAIAPFLLLGAARRRRFAIAAVAALLALAAASVAVFGWRLPNLGDQTSLMTGLSLPNLAGLLAGQGGASGAVRAVAEIVLAGAVAALALAFARRGRDWLSGAGWAALALLATLSWLVPWYIAWALPFAALAESRRLRRATLAFTAFLLLTWLPLTGMALDALHISPWQTPLGHESLAKLRLLLH